MVQTRRQKALAALGAGGTNIDREATSVPDAFFESSHLGQLPPEIFLLVMKEIAAGHKLGTFLKLSLASKAFAALAKPVLDAFPRITVFLALYESKDEDSKSDFQVFGVYCTWRDAQLELEDQDQYWDMLDPEADAELLAKGPPHADFLTEPMTFGGCSEGRYWMEKHCVFGDLKKDRVWVRIAKSRSSFPITTCFSI
jgi:hypothetical protein